jgi:hypothetical protein
MSTVSSAAENFTCGIIDYNELQVQESVTESSGVMVKQTFMEVLLETSRAPRSDVVNLIGKKGEVDSYCQRLSFGFLKPEDGTDRLSRDVGTK